MRFIGADLRALADSVGFHLLPPILTRFCGRDLPATAHPPDKTRKLES